MINSGFQTRNKLLYFNKFKSNEEIKGLILLLESVA